MSNEKKPLTAKRVLLEIFAGLLSGSLLWIVAIKSTSFGIASLIIGTNLVVIAAALVLAIKLIKKSYKIFGCILIVFLVPLVLIALLFGACTAFIK